MSDPIIDTFEMVAERQGDIAQAVYRRFYQRSAEAEHLMSHVDAYMQGRMMDEVLGLLMTPPDELPAHYLTFETRNHASYGVPPALYLPLFEAVRDVARAAAGGDWSESLEAAWSERISALQAHILAVAPNAAALATRTA